MLLILQLALTHIAGRKRQMAVAAAGVALGVGFSIAMAALMQGTQDDFIRQLVDTMPHVQVSDETRTAPRQPAEASFAAVEFHGLRPKEDRRGIRNPTAVVAGLRAWLPGRLAPRLRAQAVVRYAGRDVGASLIGVEPAAEIGVSSILDDVTAGNFQLLAAGGNNIAIGTKMADKLSASIGTTLSVVSATGLARSFRIVALFHTGVTARDEGEAYVLLKNAQILSERPDVINTIDIRLRTVDAARAIAARIEAQTGYKAVSWEEANESLLEALVVRNVIMYTVVAAILLVAGFGIYNIISTITNEKARDIAILKSLGFDEADMRRLFLAEGLLIGVGGSLAGWAVGFGLSFVLSRVHFEIRTGATEITHLPLTWSFSHYLIAAAFALVSAGVAGYLPARRAARVNPVDIIRGAT